MLDALGPDVRANGRFRLQESMRRAFKIRIEALEVEQAADMREFDLLYVRNDQLLLLIVERQERLRRFRELLARGRRHEGHR